MQDIDGLLPTNYPDEEEEEEELKATLEDQLTTNYDLSAVVANYSEGYATFVRCLIGEADRLNYTIGDGFWVHFLHLDSSHSTSYSSPPSSSSSATPTSSSASSSSPAPSPYAYTSQRYNLSGIHLSEGNDSTSLGYQDSDLLASWTWEGSPEVHISYDVIRNIVHQCFALSTVINQPRPYLLDWWQQLLWTLVFGTMMAMAVGGNTLVMWIIFAHRRMQTVTNYFLMNLSAADIFMSVLNCMFNFIYMLHSDWPFGGVYCTISNFMANVTISASVLTLMAISFDRYIAIVKPLEPRMSKTTARIFIFVIWGSSMLLALPCILYSDTVSITYKNNEIRRGCILRWPDGQSSSSRHEHIYNIVFFITTYLLPMLVMLVCYFLIGRELWGSRTIGEMTERQLNSIRSKRRVVKMFIVIVLAFGLCWLPQQAFFLYTYHNAQILDTANIQHIYLAFYWLAMANAMINPLIYYWMNARFRTYFRELVLQCVCLRWPRRNLSYEGSPEMVRRHPPCEEHSSRSRSDTRPAVNGTMRTTPGSNNHLLVYSSRERLNSRNGWRRNVGSSCEGCRTGLRPALLNDLIEPHLDSQIQMVPLTSNRDMYVDIYTFRPDACCHHPV